MRGSVRKQKVIALFLSNLGMLLICPVFVIPFLWMFLSSFKTGLEIIKIPPTFFPERFTLQNYLTIFKRLDFGRYFLNSILVSSVITIAAVFISSLVGYVFSKYHFKGKEFFFVLSISGLMIPVASTILPLYLLVCRTLGLGDSYVGLVLPFLVNPFGIFLMRQFMETIPRDIIDAARLDGASDFQIYYRIVIPLTLAAMGAVAVFSFLNSWNQLWWPLMIISTQRMRTLPLGVAALAFQHAKRFDMVVTGASLSVIPVMVVFALAQRQMVKGITLTGMKI
jgi:multiple sugar transport system permease protein